MRAFLLATSFIALLAMTPSIHAQPRRPDLGPGVSESLAIERASRVADVRYSLAFDIPENRSDRISARTTISFALSDASAPVALDFEPNTMGALRQVSIAGTPVTAELRDGHVLLPVAALRTGQNVVDITFDAGDAPLNRNDDFLYTILVPARARGRRWRTALKSIGRRRAIAHASGLQTPNRSPPISSHSPPASSLSSRRSE